MQWSAAGATLTALGGHDARLASCVSSESGRLVCSSAAGFTGVLVFFLVLELGFLVLSIIATVKIVTKAGYSGWWVLMAFVPVANVVMFLIFAFSKWPVLQKLEALRRQGYTSGYGYGYGSAPLPGQPSSWGGGARRAGPQTSSPSAGYGYPPSAPGTSSTGGQPTASAAPDPPIPPFTRGGQPAPQAGTPGAPGPSPSSGQQEAAPSTLPAAGWYPTPDGRRRYWDGTGWTDHFA